MNVDIAQRLRMRIFREHDVTHAKIGSDNGDLTKRCSHYAREIRNVTCCHGHKLLVAWLFWKTENALAHDVALNLARSTPNGFGTREEER